MREGKSLAVNRSGLSEGGRPIE
ncbi:unnamed protein product, partial [Rotaria sordida]